MSNYSLFSRGLLCVFFMCTSSLTQAQDLAVDVARQYVQDNAATLGLTDADVRGMKLSDVYASNHNGVTHVYLQQRHQGIGVHNGLINVNVRGSQVLSAGNRFVSNLAGKVATAVPGLPAEAAAAAAAGHVGLAVTEPLTVRESTPGAEQAGRLSRGGFASEDIPVRLVYQQLENGDVHLAWDVGIYTLDAQNYWSMRVDASTGAVLDVNDLVVHDNWGAAERASSAGLFASSMSALLKTSAADATAMLNPDSYNVFPLPAESPLHPVGSGTPQSLVFDPASATASPFGWHDTNGSPGAEFTITRGNNVHAYQDLTNSGTPSSPEPNGGATLDFNFAFDFGVDPTDATTANASITNLFYWSNISHDVLYEYGFDEPAGNFQVNNYGNGGVGGDDVRAEGQDGGGNCNANMLTPSDGSRPRMQMYLCDNVVPRRDGDLDHGVVIHEYVHGLSNRLTGGPATVSCLNNVEQMGEGWSDWYALVMTQQPGDTGPQGRGIGTYLFGQPPNGPGIRARPYSTDFAINEFTYDNIKFPTSVPHGVGHVWATMIWDLTWALIGGDPNFPDIPNAGDDGAGGGSGFDPDLYAGNGGNNLALQLVTDGLKLQPCSPGFVDGRNAILQADANLTGGLNECAIWHVFARRGLGHSASQGSTNNRSDGTEAFDLPPGIPATCGVPPPMADLSLTKTVDNPNPNVGDNVIFTVTVSNGGPDVATGVAVGDPLPSGFTYVSSTTTQGTYNSGTGEWTVETIANGGNAVLTITAEVLATGDHDNVAQVTASNLGDPDSTPNNNVPSEDDQDNATAAPPTPEPIDVHVEDIVTGTESAPKGRKRGTATVTVFDDVGGPAAGYTVNGTFSGSISESASGTTGPDGTVTLVTTGSTKSKNPTIDFCVDSIDGSLDYDKNDNTDPAYDCGGNGNPTTTHVESIVTGQQGAGGGEKRGAATVTIFSNLESAVSDATVMGTFSGDLGGAATGVTGADGTVLLTTPGTKKGKVNVSFCVDSVTHGSLTYAPADNHDPGAACNIAKRGDFAESVPETFALGQNYPNPFNPSTQIGFQLPEAEHVRLSVYDVMGREVARLVDRPMEAGVHRATFDASTLPSGTYIYRITTDTHVDTRRMVLVK